ncbi:putative transposon-encoded protein [Methanococcus voltae]|uniref:Putative transposon-encoded protein n=1 Tax=Methanococcus voltae TaxID=2188 RepID=A0A8J7URW6_METVO|nr:DUF2080 family transposase-associated protein [Methanococcus voltae]MBP2202198.1 putative transposon-encoded protein [Methanococcus voltae]
MASTAKLDTPVYYGVIKATGNSARFALPKSELGKEAILIILPKAQSLKNQIINALVEKEPEEA